MKIFICSLLLSCSAVSSGSAGVSDEMLRDRLVLCGQFVINDPDPLIIRDVTDDCCRSGNRIRDCHVHDWGG
jgi:hypothetical protein